ncbi:MAG: hypothetical protein ACI8PT_004741 [Gammaproteobacteria bacterium]|jgi:hypothetical protein
MANGWILYFRRKLSGMDAYTTAGGRLKWNLMPKRPAPMPQALMRAQASLRSPRNVPLSSRVIDRTLLDWSGAADG